MIQYIFECIAFQLLFLLVFDLFLQKETFFQWNRVYLIASYALSLLLPVIKIAAFKTSLPEDFRVYPENLWQQDFSEIVVTEITNHWFWNMPIENKILYGGMLVSLLLFGYKLKQIRTLKTKGEVHFFKKYTKVLMKKSMAAFSFFKTIFMGDQIKEEYYESILEHELVHINQKHSYDLLFFEFMRIIGWFNPLVYLYQKRIAEVHEFIADAKVSKEHKREQYQLLLSQVFQTQNISFINQFFKSSIIKKRIVMLQKSESSTSSKLKYLMLLPLVLGMLFYTSCNEEGLQKANTNGDEISLEERINLLETEIKEKENLTEEENSAIAKMIYNIYPKDIKGLSGKEGNIEYTGVPFAVVDKAPVFPGCEDAENKRACFNTMMQKHISKNFKYPLEAQELGIQGKVHILFTISETGEITNIRKRGPHKLLEEETARIISKLPVMKPGVHDGKKVDVPFSIPISFKLNLDNELQKKPEGIKVRGNSTIIKMENPPLILLDGKEISKEEMDKIETSTIASVNVFKDEAAAEKYEDKGENGVIEITLKK